MKTVLRYLKDYKIEAILAPLFKMLEATFELFVPLVMADIIDIGITNADKPYIFGKVFILVILGVVGLASSLTAQFFAAKAATYSSAKMRLELFSHLQKISFRGLDDIGTSTMITRLTADSNQVQNGINMALRLLLRSPFIVFGAMIMAFTVDVQGAIIFVVIIPLLAIVVSIIMGITIPLFKKVQGGLDKVLSSTRENLGGVRVIRAFHKEDDELEKFEDRNQTLTKLSLRVGKISALMNPLTFVLINLATIVLIYVGAIRVDNGVITTGAVVALINYMSQILVELIKLANLIILTNKLVASAARIESVFEIPVKEKNVDADAQKRAMDAPVSVELKGVSLRYHEEGDEAITNVNLMAKEGETIGIIGGTGAGKSTLVNLIAGFYEATKGEVRISGENIESLSDEYLRELIGCVPQKAVLFSGTIRDNLTMGMNRPVTDEELWKALDAAQASGFVREKEGGLDYEILQGGKNLSGGQRQRLTIARALARNPRILILDDSSSALDYATDAALRGAIRGLDSRPLTFIVSQRTASMLQADNIIVLDDGDVAGYGKHEQLLKNCEVYREIYASQFGEEAMQNEG